MSYCFRHRTHFVIIFFECQCVVVKRIALHGFFHFRAVNFDLSVSYFSHSKEISSENMLLGHEPVKQFYKVNK